jgi:hypothetical protein
MIILILILISVYFYEPSLALSDIVYFINDNNDINLHGHIKVDKEAGRAIGQGLQVIGSNIGLGATIAGVATAVSKAMAKTSLPPLQRAGVILGSSAIMGLYHSKLIIMNRRSVLQDEINSNNLRNTEQIKDNLSSNSFLTDSSLTSPLSDLLDTELYTNYVLLSLLILLLVQLLFKLHFKDSIKLNLSPFLSERINRNLESIINKLISANKKMSSIYI